MGRLELVRLDYLGRVLHLGRVRRAYISDERQPHKIGVGTKHPKAAQIIQMQIEVESTEA